MCIVYIIDNKHKEVETLIHVHKFKTFDLPC